MEHFEIAISRNTTLLVLSRFTSKIITFLLSIYIARQLGDIRFGILAFAISITNIFVILPRYGFNILSVRDIARNANKTSIFLYNVLFLKFIFSVITGILITIYMRFLSPNSDAISIVLVMAISVLSISFIDFFMSLYRAHQKMEYEAALSFVGSILTAFLGVIIIYLGYDLIGYVMCRAVIYLFLAIGSYLLVKKLVDSKSKINIKFCKYLLKSSLPFVFLGIFTTIYFQIDTVMLSYMRGFQATGWYNAAYRFLWAFIFIPSSFAAASLPAMSRFYPDSMESFERTYMVAIKRLFLIAISLVVPIAVFSDKIILLVYGETFISSIPVLRILIITLLFSFLNPILGSVLIAINKQNHLLLVTGGGALLNVAMNLLLIPLWGCIGAGITTLVTEIILFIIYLVFISRFGLYANFGKVLFTPILCGLLFLGSLFIFHNTVVSIGFGILVYFFSIIALRVVDKKDIVSIRQIFRK